MSSVASLEVMGQALTRPYKRGMETLELTFGATAAGVTAIAPYGFQDYARLYGRLPDDPRYLLEVRFEVGEPLEVRIGYVPTPGAATETATVEVEAGTPPGASFAVPLAAPATDALRLVALEARPEAPPGPPAQNWGVLALLGNLGRLLWVLGREYDVLASTVADVRAQRRRASARGRGLDLLGADLGVPRFPPGPYSIDADTLALYHLDDVPAAGQAEVTVVADERERHQPGLSHPGTNGQAAAPVPGAVSRRPGRFGSAFSFGAAGPSAVVVPDAPDFALPAAPLDPLFKDLTVEAMVRPRRRGTGAVGPVLAKRAVLNAPGQPGWSLATGAFRAIEENLRFSVSDGTTEAELFADADLADGRYHHVAGVVERRGADAVVRLYLDGARVEERRLAGLGDLTSPEPLRMGWGLEDVPGTGPVPAFYAGLLDEVRVSRVARTSFHPVVAEGDEEYRRRLGIFERWLLPAPKALLDAVNELVRIDGHTDSFVLLEDDSPVTVGSRRLRVLPDALRAGAALAADGRRAPSEEAVAGRPEDEPEFDPAWLVRHGGALRVQFPDESRRRMQVRTASALDRLAAALPSGAVDVRRAYDSEAAGLHRVGRALTLVPVALTAEQVALAAHAVDFDVVRWTPDNVVHVAIATGEALAIDPTALTPPAAGGDVDEGEVLRLRVRPPGPLDAQVRWVLVRCGFGDGSLSSATDPQTDLLTARAGELVVRVELSYRRRRAAGSLRVRIGLPVSGPGALTTVGANVAGTGERDASEVDAAGTPAAIFEPAYLHYHSSVGVDYGADQHRHRMQRAAAERLDRLLDVLPAGGTLTVLQAYTPGTPDLYGQGRALRVAHDTLAIGELAALAFGARFDFVRVEAPGELHLAMREGEQIGISSSEDVVTVGASVDLALAPQGRPAAVAALPDGSAALVAQEGTGVLTRVRLEGTAGAAPRARVDGAVLVGPAPGAVVLAPGGQLAVVANRADDTLTAVALPALQAAPAVPTGMSPEALAQHLSPAGIAVAVACAGDDSVRVHALPGLGQQAVVSVPAGPGALAVGSAGRVVWVSCRGAQALASIDAAAVPPAVFGAAVALTEAPAGIAITPDGARAYVALPAADVVVPVTLATRTLGAAIVVPGGPEGLVLSPNGARLYVACPTGGRIVVVDTATGTALPTPIPLPRDPSALAAVPAAGTAGPAVLATARAGSDLSVIDPQAIGSARSPIADTVGLGSGLGERLSWSASPLAFGTVGLSSQVAPALRARGERPGGALVRALLAPRGATSPYQFELRLKPVLDVPGTVIRKDQYDILMNVLNSFHPVGVEVRTQNVREHVIEVADGRLDALPAYTFPAFRTRRLAALEDARPRSRS